MDSDWTWLVSYVRSIFLVRSYFVDGEQPPPPCSPMGFTSWLLPPHLPQLHVACLVLPALLYLKVVTYMCTYM